MVALQAFVDDSASDAGDKRLFLAGYIQRADVWAAFSDAWQRELHRHPRIEYFKMAEANALRGQFKGWSKADRDTKVMRLARLVHAHHPHFVFCSVSREEYSRILAPIAPQGLKTPYSSCYWGVINAAARYHLSTGIKDMPAVDFIFDEQGGLGDDAALFYDWQKEDSKPELRQMLGSTPIFQDDRQVMPLQAADMLAWHVRKSHETGGLAGDIVFELLTEQGVGMEIDATTLATLARQMRRIPGVTRIQTKKEWRDTKRSIRQQIAAGADPPRTGMWWMRYIAFRAWIDRTKSRWWRFWAQVRRR